MTREQRIFTEATRGETEDIPAHVLNWAWESASARFFAACEVAREKVGPEDYEATIETEGPGYARFLFVEELSQACRDHNLFVKERKLDS